MKEKMFLSVLVVLMVAFVSGCATSLRDFQPATPDEAGIKEFFLKMEEMSRKNDLDGLVQLYHPKAKIMSGRERTMLSREEYLKAIKESRDKVLIQYGIPKIKKIEGKKAEVDIILRISGTNNVTLYTKFLLIRSNGKWLAMERTFTY